MNPRMKKSDLKSYIRENIIEILSEEEGTITTKDSTEAEKLAKKGINVKRISYDSNYSRSIPCLGYLSWDIWNSDIKWLY